MLDRNYDFSFGMPSFNMADCICNVMQGEALIDNRCHLARFDKIFHNTQMLLVGFCQQVPNGLPTLLGAQRAEDHGLEHLLHGTARRDIDALGSQSTLIGGQRLIAIGGKNEVILLATLGEIFFGVVDDMIRTQRTHHRELCPRRIRR